MNISDTEKGEQHLPGEELLFIALFKLLDKWDRDTSLNQNSDENRPAQQVSR
jgi:hypothetical protein